MGFIPQKLPGNMIVGVPVFNLGYLGIVAGTGQSLNHVEPVAHSVGATCSVVLTGYDSWIAWVPHVFKLWRCCTTPDHLAASRGANLGSQAPGAREPTNTQYVPPRVG